MSPGMHPWGVSCWVPMTLTRAGPAQPALDQVSGRQAAADRQQWQGQMPVAGPHYH